MTMAITFIPGDISSGCGAILILLFFTLIPVSFAGMMTDVPAVPCLHHITPMIARARGIIIMAQPIINMIPSLMPDKVKKDHSSDTAFSAHLIHAPHFSRSNIYHVFSHDHMLSVLSGWP